MMIRINLLPFREEERKKKIRNEIFTFFLSFFIIALFLVILAFYMDNIIVSIEEDTQKIISLISIHKEKADRVSEIEKQLDSLDGKIAVIDNLRHKQYRQVNLLVELSHIIVKDRMWIEQIKMDLSKIIIQGMAFDNNTIAIFISRLESSLQYVSIDLKQSSSKSLFQGQPLWSFILECQSNPDWRFVQEKEKTKK